MIVLDLGMYGVSLGVKKTFLNIFTIFPITHTILEQNFDDKHELYAYWQTIAAWKWITFFIWKWKFMQVKLFLVFNLSNIYVF